MRPLALCSLVALMGVGACGGGSTPSTDAGLESMLRVEAVQDSVAIKPSESRVIAFRLLDSRGQPVSDRLLQFNIVDDPGTAEDEARGATLSFDRGITDATGEVRVPVNAGLPTVFRVRASADRASAAEAVVVVSSGNHGAVEVLPVFESEETSDDITTIRLHFYDGGTCGKLNTPGDPPVPVRPARVLPIDTSVVYSSISTEGNHAILAMGLDAAGTQRVGGCVDLPGAAVLLQDTVRVLVPMRSVRPSPEGKFDATSHLQFLPSLKAASTLADAWKELSACGLDPVSLWLDCTIDALGPLTPEDPLDCRPADEGPVGNKLLARRGTATKGTARCRERTDGAAQPSIDALANALLPTPRPALVGSLPALGTEARQLLNTVKLRSMVQITATSARDRYQLNHRVGALEFLARDGVVSVDLRELGSPAVLARFVTVERKKSDLEIARHGFTLRLGSAARLAFSRASLVPRGVTGDPAAFVTALFAQATRTDRTGAALTGCAALDDLLCAEINEPKGCVVAACNDGLAALARSLDAGFAALDGEDMDLFLEGTAPLVDRDGDRRADALGWLLPGSAFPAIWSGELRGRGAVSTFTAIWTADRLP